MFWESNLQEPGNTRKRTLNLKASIIEKDQIIFAVHYFCWFQGFANVSLPFFGNEKTYPSFHGKRNIIDSEVPLEMKQCS